MSDENTSASVEGADTASEWDGSFDTLEKQSWYASIPEKARPHLQSWHESQAERDFFKQLANGEPDTAKYLQEREADRARLADLERQLQEAGQSKKELEALREQITAEKVDQEFKMVREKFPDIVNHEKDDVFNDFVDLVAAGKSHELAAKMVRAAYDITPGAPTTAGTPAAAAEPAKTREVVVPKSEDAMNATSNNPAPDRRGKYHGMKWDEAKIAMAKDIEMEEKGM